MDNTDINQEVELCVNCGKETQYKQSDHIDYRMGYIEGAGQLCSRCNYNEIFIKNTK